MGCLSAFFATLILIDAFGNKVWHGREWAEFALGLALLFGGMLVDFFEDE